MRYHPPTQLDSRTREYRRSMIDEWNDMWNAALDVQGVDSSELFASGNEIYFIDAADAAKASALLDAWGETASTGPTERRIHLWTNPDGSGSFSSTRDYLTFYPGDYVQVELQGDVYFGQDGSPFGSLPWSWALVSDSSTATVPEPTSLSLMAMLGGIGVAVRRRCQRTANSQTAASCL